MSNLELFKGNPLVNSELFKSLMDMNKKMAGGTGAAGKRISIRGGKFRMMVDGEQVAVNKSDTMNVVIVNAGDVSRTYYAGAFDPENPSSPTCWSVDTRTPSPDVHEDQRQASRCSDCPMNVKGSGQGDSRACRFSQRLALVLEGDLETVYQIQIPAKSIFGEARGNDMGLQAYIKFLSVHDTPAIAVMTELRFDEDATAPRLYFSPVRALDEGELASALTARESEEATKAITLTVSQLDSGEKGSAKTPDPGPASKPKPKPKPKPALEVVEVDEVIEDDEPVKVEKATKAPAPEPKTSSKLAAVLSGWDDE